MHSEGDFLAEISETGPFLLHLTTLQTTHRYLVYVRFVTGSHPLCPV